MKTITKIVSYLALLASLFLITSCLDLGVLNAGGDTTESGNFISGTVLSGIDPVKNTIVYLYKENKAVTPAVFIKSDSTNVDAEGKYTFELNEEATIYLTAKYNSKIYKLTDNIDYKPSPDYEVASIDITTKNEINKEAVADR